MIPERTKVEEIIEFTDTDELFKNISDWKKFVDWVHQISWEYLSDEDRTKLDSEYGKRLKECPYIEMSDEEYQALDSSDPRYRDGMDRFEMEIEWRMLNDCPYPKYFSRDYDNNRQWNDTVADYHLPLSTIEKYLNMK